MRCDSLFLLALVVLAVGCGDESRTDSQGAQADKGARPTPAPTAPADDEAEPSAEREPLPNATAAQPPTPEPTNTTGAEDTGETAPDPGLEPNGPEPKGPKVVVDESVQAFGKKTFGTLHGDDADAFLALTPYANDELKATCPRLTREAGLESKLEVTARFKHCRKLLDWSAVEEATVAGGELTGDRSPGCEGDIAELEPIRMRVKTPAGVFAVDLFAPVARDGEVIGISGALKCAPLR